MGIYDRHYIRNDGGAGASRPRAVGLGAARTWSVNTWIIVICVGIFVLDGFLPPGWVPMSVQWDRELVERGIVPKDPPVALQRPSRSGVTSTERIIATGADGVSREIGRRAVVATGPLQKYLHFSTKLGFLHVEFWRLVGFQFLHGNLTHLLFNMIGLFFFGPMVERYLGSKRYLAFYLLCGIFGALMYVLLNLGGLVSNEIFGLQSSIPGLLFNDSRTPLIGASAGVFGVLMAGAFLAPNATVLVFFILPMRLRTLAYALVAIALLSVFTGRQNAGGEAGHLGGALAGFYFIRHPRHLHGFFDILGRLDPTSHHYRHRARAAGGRKLEGDRAEVDRILDKVHTKGLRSLTDREKRILREASEEG